MRRVLSGLALWAALAASAPAGAQPSDAAVNAVRASCRGDYIAHCMGVPRGGREALECLQRNQPSLSSGCRHALAEIGTGAGGAALTERCAAQIGAMCPGIAPGGGRLVACLADRRESLGEACRAALDAARAAR
jgi:hypothetical protein